LIALNILYYSEDAKKRVFDNILSLKNIDKKCMFESEDNNKVFFLVKGASVGIDKKDIP
jgi:hypothetical protein